MGHYDDFYLEEAGESQAAKRSSALSDIHTIIHEVDFDDLLVIYELVVHHKEYAALLQIIKRNK